MSQFRAYLELTKPRIAVMVLIMAAFGYLLALGGFSDPLNFVLALLGTALAGGGASVLNQYLERDIDALMERTRNRPIPAGQVSPQASLYFGVALALGGCFLLQWQVNLLTAFLALLSTFLYVLVYTPMKRVTWWNTVVGAIPGAMPPLIGWAAATGTLDLGAWALFAILYFWQFPHFYAIAWMHRQDYARGGLKMLSVVKPDGKNLSAQTILFSILLVPASVVPYLLGMTGMLYLSGALIAGAIMLATGVRFALTLTNVTARQELRTSLVYLPALLLLLAVDFGW